MDPNGTEFAESKYHEGRNFLENGEYAKGQKCLETALPIFKKNLCISRIADTNYNLGRCLLEQGNYEDGGNHFELAFVKYRNNLAPDDTQLAHTKYNLAKCLLEQSKYKDAQEFFESAFKAYVDRSESYDLQVPHTKYNLGRCFNGQGMIKKAEKYYLEALADYQEKLGEQDLIVADTKYNLGEWFFSIKKIEVAENFFIEAREIFMNQLGSDNSKVINTQNWLRRCLTAPGRSMTSESTVSDAQTTALPSAMPLQLPGYRQSYVKANRVVYIMNHFKYDKAYPEQRDGSLEDVATLVETFAKFNVTIKERHDQTKEEIMTLAKEEAETDYSVFDFVIYIIMTHGRENKILAARDEEYNLECDFMQQLLQNNTWKGVPKVFIIQACRGDRTTDANPFRIPPKRPNDILWLFSTFKGHASYRSTEMGAEFIQELCAKIKTYGNAMDVISIMEGVIGKIALTSPTPELRSTFSKKLYLGKTME